MWGLTATAWAQRGTDQEAAEANLLAAETGPRPIRYWTREEYGAGPVVMSIALHPATDFVYLGTGRGVSEYDGVRWHYIDPPDRGPTRGATVDSRGRIWTGRYNGVFLLEPDAAGELHLRPQPELLPPELREIGSVRQVTNTPVGVCFTARQNVIVIPPSGPLRAWRAEEPFGNTWWMNGALHNSVAQRGTYRLEAGGGMTKLHQDSPVLLAARPGGADETLLLTTRGPLVWRETTGRFETPAGYGGFFRKSWR